MENYDILLNDNRVIANEKNTFNFNNIFYINNKYKSRYKRGIANYDGLNGIKLFA